MVHRPVPNPPGHASRSENRFLLFKATVGGTAIDSPREPILIPEGQQLEPKLSGSERGLVCPSRPLSDVRW